MMPHLPAEQPTQLHIAFALTERPEDDLPSADAVVEVPEDRYPVLADHAWESGFGMSMGDVPPTTAEVHVRYGHFTGLVLAGGRQAWTMGAPTMLTESWLASARAYGVVAVQIVPPGTWPVGAERLEGEELVEVFNARLREVAETAVILHGAAAYVVT
jgi:hypothetical protein